MYPDRSLPSPAAWMQPSTTCQGIVSESPLKSFHWSRLLPSKSSCQPSAISAWVRVLCLGQQEQRLAAMSPVAKSVRNRVRLGFDFISSILEVS